MKETTPQADAGGALLLAEFVRVITRSRIVVWSRTDDADDDSGFSAAIDSGASDLEILVSPTEAGFMAAIAWYDEDDDAIAEMEAAVAAELYAEVEESWRASGSRAHVNAEVAVIRRGAAAPTMRPYGPADEEGDEATPQEQFVVRKILEVFTRDELSFMAQVLANEADVMEEDAPYSSTVVSIMRKLRLVVPRSLYAPGRGSPDEVAAWLDKQR
jgi:hypothetical protein